MYASRGERGGELAVREFVLNGNLPAAENVTRVVRDLASIVAARANDVHEL